MAHRVDLKPKSPWQARDHEFGITKAQLEKLGGDMVDRALKRQRETSDAHLASVAADAGEQQDLTAKLKRVKVWAAALVAVAVGVSGVSPVIYTRGQEDATRATKELEQDTRISNTAAAFAAHRRQAAEMVSEQAQKLRNMGALQIEQGNDQRSILLDSAPKSVAEKHKAKPDALQDAEATVRRD